jgi:hypothetical protein
MALSGRAVMKNLVWSVGAGFSAYHASGVTLHTQKNTLARSGSIGCINEKTLYFYVRNSMNNAAIFSYIISVPHKSCR